VRIGISVASAHVVDDARLGARNMIERARAVQQAGLDSLFVGDHHVTPRPYYQNSPILGRMLAEWGDRPAGALYLLPLWHPVLLAEQVATLASICRGRFILQCALGGDEAQSAGMGVDHRQRVAMFELALETLRSLWRGESITLDRFWPVREARISPRPPEPIEVWIGAMAAPAINRAARLGDGWLGSPAWPYGQAVERLNVYRQACAEHGRAPTAVALRREVYVGASAEEARRVVAPYAARGHRGLPEEALLVGSVVEVVDELARYREAGYTDIIVRNISADQAEALATIERLAQVKAALAR
jgi:alkanesulfonate monooxygenase SsuD/methylene tetrahydromethanopterin reductase-like flavin-dependent oxidoreductase (luciferase family)